MYGLIFMILGHGGSLKGKSGQILEYQASQLAISICILLTVKPVGTDTFDTKKWSLSFCFVNSSFSALLMLLACLHAHNNNMNQYFQISDKQ